MCSLIIKSFLSYYERRCGRCQSECCCLLCASTLVAKLGCADGHVGKSVISEQYYQSDPVDCAIAKASKLIAEKEPLASPVFASSVRSYCTIRYSSMER